MHYLSLLAQAAAEPKSDPFMPMLLFFGVVGLAFYFLILRPQKKEQASKEAKLSTLKKGDKIVTAGGIWGTVTNTGKTDTVEVEIAKNVKVIFNRSAVAVIQDDKKKNDDKKNDTKDS